MSQPHHDIAIVGGGLAGGLIALALHKARPDLDLVLLEAGATLGGKHRWSWFERDLTRAGNALMADFGALAWSSNAVRFPGYERQLAAGYRSLDNGAFDDALRRVLPAEAIRTGHAVAALREDGVTLADGSQISAATVIDCRTLGDIGALEGGWQVFLGQTLRTRVPHGMTRPTIMDAAVAQPGAYRFVYVLPLSEREVFIEDTYYTDSATLDVPVLRQRIAEYAAAQGIAGDVVDEEVGVLPVITGGDFAAWRAASQVRGVARAGARAGLVHPLTSYTLPIAVETALAVAADADLRGAAMAAALDRRAEAHWRATRFYRVLGKMLFGAARPEDRWRIFARFYRLPEPLIERFYAARSTPLDKIRILSGRPPVPIGAAIRALLGKGHALVHDGRE